MGLLRFVLIVSCKVVCSYVSNRRLWPMKPLQGQLPPNFNLLPEHCGNNKAVSVLKLEALWYLLRSPSIAGLREMLRRLTQKRNGHLARDWFEVCKVRKSQQLLGFRPDGMHSPLTIVTRTASVTVCPSGLFTVKSVLMDELQFELTIFVVDFYLSAFGCFLWKFWISIWCIMYIVLKTRSTKTGKHRIEF